MINQTFLHFKGVGEKSFQKIREAGIHTWEDLDSDADSLPFSQVKKDSLTKQAGEYLNKKAEKDRKYFSGKIKTKEKWRVLQEYREDLAFFDTETDGLGADSRITLIVCKYREKFYQFVRGKNLDEFCDFLHTSKILISFNGNSFDVPKILNAFRIPELPCGHVDLRWVLHHFGYRGGLKDIEVKTGIKRSSGIVGVDGYEAVLLWREYFEYGNQSSLDKLISYCTQDVQSLEILTDMILSDTKLNTSAGFTKIS